MGHGSPYRSVTAPVGASEPQTGPVTADGGPGSFAGVQVAVVQLSSGLDKERNRRRAVEAVTRAAGSGAALVVLPEATMCGFGSATTALGPLAEALDGPFVGALAEATARTGVTAVAGMFESVGGDEARVHNTLVAVGPDGLRAAYRKLHLYDALGWCESARVAPGSPDPDNLTVLEAGELQIGLMTCYDLRFPEMARALVDRGATALVLGAAWVPGPHKAEHWSDLLRARAIESTAYVLAAAQPAPEFTGRSAVIDPMGLTLAAADADADGPGEGLLQATVEADRVREVRAGMPVLSHRRFEVRPRA